MCVFSSSLPSAVIHGMLEASGKAAGTPAVTQGQGPCGVCFCPQLAEIPHAGEQGDTKKALVHMGCAFCLHRLDKQAPRQNMAFFF